MRRPTDVLLRRPAPGIAEIVLDGPPLNILDANAQRQLTSVLTELHGESDLDALLVCGAGDRAFSVGADISEPENAEGGDPWGGVPLSGHWTRLLETLPALTIAVVQGHCLGGGLELVLCADLCIASPHSTFGLPEVRIGLIPGMGATVRLPARVGRPWATRLLMTGAPVGASTAARIGLVQALDPQPRELALAWLADLAPAAPLARRRMKSLIATGEGYDAERRAWQALARTDDAAEGRRAFLAHRPARFAGC